MIVPCRRVFRALCYTFGPVPWGAACLARTGKLSTQELRNWTMNEQVAALLGELRERVDRIGVRL